MVSGRGSTGVCGGDTRALGGSCENEEKQWWWVSSVDAGRGVEGWWGVVWAGDREEHLVRIDGVPWGGPVRDPLGAFFMVRWWSMAGVTEVFHGVVWFWVDLLGTRLGVCFGLV